jgi:hypothetical protein
VGGGDATDEAFAARPAQIVGGLAGAVGLVEQRGHRPGECRVAEAPLPRSHPVRLEAWGLLAKAQLTRSDIRSDEAVARFSCD